MSHHQELVTRTSVAPASREALGAALDEQARLRPVPIGEALLALGKLSREQLSSALSRQAQTQGMSLGQVLVEMGLVATADLQLALLTKMGYPFVDLRVFPHDAQALRRVPASLALRLKVLPLMEWRSTLIVAMSDPLQFKVLDELEFTSQCKVRPVVTTTADLGAQIVKAYRGVGLSEQPRPTPAPAREAREGSELNAQLLAAELAGGDSREPEEDKPIEQSDNTLVRLINSMITEAYHQRASDIHIEPYPGREKVSIRFRIDGELRPYLELPPSYRNALIARLKIMCDLDISERRKPQDGKIDFSRYGGMPLELRVATIPTAHGLEDVVMRLLTSAKVSRLDSIDLSPANLRSMESILERPYGLFLCVGPTGSGKTTTLHSALQRVNRPNRKIWTAEDPVEITQHGLRQIQVNARIGWTFAAALRSLLRADPDVIMVGEIRDAQTAEIAIEASLTGHMVLSTLHTNSAAETIVRLNDLGVDSFSFADSLQGVLAQRLVRRLCPACTSSRPLSQQRLDAIIDDYQSALPAGHVMLDRSDLQADWLLKFGRDGVLLEQNAAGCEQCGNTGFRGRLALHELLIATPAIRQLVQQRGRPAEIRDMGLHEGMRTLRQDGIEKALAGLTSLAEVRASTVE
jgi:type II secretory ATPase GspE/PulE/Tfp pilus assembly ATPase PilB-like protein